MSAAAGMRGVGRQHGRAGEAPFAQWFASFLRRELAPYPGRASLVTRMVASSMITLLIAMSFHLTGASLGVFYTFLLPRDSYSNTVKQTALSILSWSLGAVYLLVGMAMFVDSPLTHFLFVAGTLYLLFLVLGTALNYGFAAGFAFMIAGTLPQWDLIESVNVKVSASLHTLLGVIIGVLASLLVETVYHLFRSQDLVIAGIADRLQTTARVLRDLGEGNKPKGADAARLEQYAMVGPSTLRQQLIRSGQSAAVRARASAAVSLSARVVELAAALLREDYTASVEDRRRLRDLAGAVGRQAAEMHGLPDIRSLGRARLPSWRASERPPDEMLLLPQFERAVRLVSEIFNSFGDPREAMEAGKAGPGRGKTGRVQATVPGGKIFGLLKPDAFSNPANHVFALRGCAAALLCYVVYNGVDWPGISTAVVTCIITALGTIGASRQKQLLRLSGAAIGGLLIALPAQVWLLPRMDSITAFSIFFAAVTAFAAWVATSSQRLSYCGVQIGLAFDLINAQEPYRQISLRIGRDRVMGVFLGLVAMWLVFDRIAAPRASDQMDMLLRTTLEKMGDLACAVADLGRGTGGKPLDRFSQLRDGINDSFSQMNAQADAVELEYGLRRDRQLRARERMQAMQPAMRSVFLLESSLWESRQMPRGEAGGTTPAMRLFLERSREVLRGIAALPRPGGRRSTLPDVQAALGRQKEALRTLRGEQAAGRETLVTLCESLVASLGALERAAAGGGTG